MNKTQAAEYHGKVMDVADMLIDVLAETDFDVAANALMAALAQVGKQSDMSTEEFLITAVAQIKQLMDHSVIVEHTIQ
jgi:vesicle coat complex subunit